MARLPTPGSDDGAWGNLLNEYLSVEHNTDGTLKLRTDGSLSASATLDADSTTKGKLQLANDLGGTASAPTVTATHLSAPLPINQGGTGSSSKNFVDLSNPQTISGVKTFVSAPVVPTPLNNTDAANKAYVDGSANSLVVSVASYGAVGDVILLTDGAIAPGSNSLASASASFSAGDVGKVVSIAGAGTAGGVLTTTIASVTDSTHVTLSATASTECDGNRFFYGTNNTAAFASAVSAVSSNGTLYVPYGGKYLVQSLPAVQSNTTWCGGGENKSFIYLAAANTDALHGIDLEYVNIHDLGIIGPGQGMGTGNGINFTLSTQNATTFVNLERLFVDNFGQDGIAIATPIVSSFRQVIPEHNGRHGINIYGAGAADGTSCSFEACFPAGNWAAGYNLKQMAYTSLNGCAADANGVAYVYDTCIGITENGCGSEETYNFNLLGKSSFTPNGLSRYIFNSKVVLNSPYMINNVGTSCWVTNNAKVVINDYYEGSPGNADDINSNPQVSLKVDTSCSVIVNNYQISTAMSLAAGTTTLAPGPVPKRTVALTDGATITPNASTADVATVTLGGNRTMAAPTGTPIDNQQLVFRITQDATGSRTITWNAAYRFAGGTAPTLTTTPNKTDYFGFQYNAASTTWDCLADRENF